MHRFAYSFLAVESSAGRLPLTIFCQSLQLLHIAVLSGFKNVVQLLVEAAADPAAQNSAGETALSLAVLVGHWECAEALLHSQRGITAVQVLYLTFISFYFQPCPNAD